MNIKDVAQRAGVSISTVSNVLNGRRNVSPEKAQAVMRAAEELNYIPNVNAQMMKRHGTGLTYRFILIPRGGPVLRRADACAVLFLR